MSNSGIAGRVVAALLLACAMPAAAEPAPARQKELIHMVRQDCGSCHGLTLQGGLGPALLPQTLADKPAEGLVATIVHGRPGTAMPPWHRFLAEEEAQWIVTRLMEGFPK
ncbi:MAG: cytochrome c [Sterolibacteriaceae bacterium]|uniref:c-type cytochrome n=1 Tax=Sulfuritalea sp. TaxID=2480090 RepID=UPI001A554616|nr:cytochrome c [Sulfuritalea sp.]MBL8479974.1 cytochrome c [Sterolibacteriaceae bacterium]MBN8475842.1 cytochrome c [Sulfuritalea sp.]